MRRISFSNKSFRTKEALDLGRYYNQTKNKIVKKFNS